MREHEDPPDTAGFGMTPKRPDGIQDDDGNGLGLLRWWGILSENKWLIAATTAIAAVLGQAQLYLTVPMYAADALVLIEDERKTLPGLDAVNALSEEEASTAAEVEVIRSRMVLGRVVGHLQLDVIAKPRFYGTLGAAVARHYRGEGPGSLAEPWPHLERYAWGGERIKVSTLAVPDRLLGNTWTLTAAGSDRFLLAGPGLAAPVAGRIGERLRAELSDGGTLQLFVSELHGRPGTEFEVSRLFPLSAIRALQGGLSVRERGRQSQVIELTFTHPDATAVVALLNEITRIYLRQNVERRSEEAQRQLSFVEKQLPDLKEQLETAEQSYNAYRRKSGSVDLAFETQALLKQIVDIEAELRLLDLRRADLTQRFTPLHPQVVALDAQIAEARSRLSALNTKIKDLPQTQQEVLNYSRELEVNTELYTSLLNSAQSLRVAKAGTIGTVRILDHAMYPASYVSPDVGKVRVQSLLGGLVVGLGLTFLLRMFRHGVEDPDEIEESLALPVYATVPHCDEQARIDKQMHRSDRGKPGAAGPSTHVVAHLEKEALAVESLRSLRTTLHFAMLDARDNSVLLTGPEPGVGKSFICVNLGVVLVQSGKRVALVDADLRKGHLNRCFGLPREHGLSEYVSAGRPFDQTVRATPIEGLYLVPTGVIPPNPSELLMHQRFAELLGELQRNYDLVLIDAPPVLAATDAVIVGQQTGATLLVVRAGMHPMRQLRDSVKRLASAGVNLRGFVFNDMPVAKRDYGYGYGYGYGYRKYDYHYSYKAQGKRGS